MTSCGKKVFADVTLKWREGLDYPAKPSANNRGPSKGGEEGVRDREGGERSGSRNWSELTAVLKTEEGPNVEEPRHPLEAGTDGMDSSQSLQKGTQSCQHLDFSPVRMILDFQPLKLLR